MTGNHEYVVERYLTHSFPYNIKKMITQMQKHRNTLSVVGYSEDSIYKCKKEHNHCPYPANMLETEIHRTYIMYTKNVKEELEVCNGSENAARPDTIHQRNLFEPDPKPISNIDPSPDLNPKCFFRNPNPTRPKPNCHLL